MGSVNYCRIGKTIREARLKRGWSQARLAEMAGVSAQYLSRIETGKKQASLQVVYGIARALQVSMDLLTGNERLEQERELPAAGRILSDCSEYERQVLLDILEASKQSLRVNARYRE